MTTSTTTTRRGAVQTGQPMLTAHDRCDRCPSRAYVRFFTSSGALELCAHHFNKNESLITRAGYVIHDERYRLYADDDQDEGGTS